MQQQKALKTETTTGEVHTPTFGKLKILYFCFIHSFSAFEQTNCSALFAASAKQKLKTCLLFPVARPKCDMKSSSSLSLISQDLLSHTLGRSEKNFSAFFFNKLLSSLTFCRGFAAHDTREAHDIKRECIKTSSALEMTTFYGLFLLSFSSSRLSTNFSSFNSRQSELSDFPSHRSFHLFHCRRRSNTLHVTV